MVYVFLMILVSIACWAYLFPEDGLALITELKRQLRLNVIRHAGADGEKELARTLHKRAAKHKINTKLVDQVLAEHHGIIVERLGNRMADRILDKVDATQRWY